MSWVDFSEHFKLNKPLLSPSIPHIYLFGQEHTIPQSNDLNESNNSFKDFHFSFI